MGVPMPWKVSDTVSERMAFVARFLKQERMSDLCREFGISRKTGYKIVARYETLGLEGLRDLSRAARSRPNQTHRAMERDIVQLRREHSSWGAKKIKSVLEGRHPLSLVPAVSTIHAILDRYGLINKIKRREVYKATGTAFAEVRGPNDLWCADFKGHFRMQNSRYCYPLTVTDQFSRYLLGCESMEKINVDECIDAFEKIFEEFGLPQAIRTDNGVPFGANSIFGLSRLSVRWLRLGIQLERIEPGCPQQSGCHERMHRTLKAETTKPPAYNILSQQEKFDNFGEIYNNERPHESLGMKPPAKVYYPSTKAYNPFLEPLIYEGFDKTLQVSTCGSIGVGENKRVFIGEPFAKEHLGLKWVDEGIWQVSFMSYDLGYFDTDQYKLQVPGNPFLIRPTQKV